MKSETTIINLIFTCGNVAETEVCKTAAISANVVEFNGDVFVFSVNDTCKTGSPCFVQANSILRIGN